MSKVYLVYCDNGEPYEDGFCYVNCIFTTREHAVEYIEKELGCIKRDGWRREEWEEPKYVCSMNNIDCEDCPNYNLDEYEENFCEEYNERLDSEYDYTFYYIEEGELVR